jgi:hypothetical protein
MAAVAAWRRGGGGWWWRGPPGEALTFYTNYGSRKARDMEACPRVALTFLWLSLERQVARTQSSFLRIFVTSELVLVSWVTADCEKVARSLLERGRARTAGFGVVSGAQGCDATSF